MADGVWTAAFQGASSTVDLGTSGSMVTITVAENGSFWIGSEAIASGGTVTAENGNVYVLTMADGAWAAMFQAGAAMQIANTPVSAVVNEEGMYVVVGGEGAIGEDGTGMVSSGGQNYRVMMYGDGLVGTLYDMVGEDASMADNPGMDAKLALSADDADTDMDESGTMLDLAALKAGGDAADSEVSLTSLFDGSNAAIEETFIADVLKTLNAELVLLKANIDIGDRCQCPQCSGAWTMPGMVPTRHLQFSDWEMQRWALPRTGTMRKTTKRSGQMLSQQWRRPLRHSTVRQHSRQRLAMKLFFQQWTMIMMRPNTAQ